MLAASTAGSTLYAIADIGGSMAESTLDIPVLSVALLSLVLIVLFAVQSTVLSILAAVLPIKKTGLAWAGILLGLAVPIGLEQLDAFLPRDIALLPTAALVSVGLGVLLYAILRPPGTKTRMSLMLLATFALAARVATDGISPESNSKAPANAPNILIVSIDSARNDHFGGEDSITPSFDLLCEEGRRFTGAFSAIARTGPSHAGLMSGTGPWDAGFSLAKGQIPEQRSTVAERFQSEGYRTGAFVGSSLLSGGGGLARGFDVYDDDFSWLRGWQNSLFGKLESRLHPVQGSSRLGERTASSALAWLQESSERPFFAWVQLSDPRFPYSPPPPWNTEYYLGDPRDPTHRSMEKARKSSPSTADLEGITDIEWPVSQYKGELSYADAQLGRLLGWLDKAGEAQETLVVFLGAHGESLGENGIWFQHGTGSGDPELHVPLAMRFPKIIKPGPPCDALVELSDIAPTIFELVAGVAPVSMTGRSFAQSIYGGKARPFARSVAVGAQRGAESPTIDASIRTPTHRLVAGEKSEFLDLEGKPVENIPEELLLRSRQLLEDVGG
jgi:arylsulfatase A-like enzyme